MTATLADEATVGLRISKQSGLVLVNDGEDRWICRLPEWQAALEKLGAKPATEDDDTSEAYTQLCHAVKGDVASWIGTNRGNWEPLVREAFLAGLIDEDDVRGYGA